MNDPEWDKQRERAIWAAFQTGRPVFADSDGELRYADGDGEPVAQDVGPPQGGGSFPDCGSWTQVGSLLVDTLVAVVGRGFVSGRQGACRTPAGFGMTLCPPHHKPATLQTRVLSYPGLFRKPLRGDVAGIDFAVLFGT